MEREIVLRLVCVDRSGNPTNWTYDLNRVRCYLGDDNVSIPVARLWNAYWDEADRVATPEDLELHDGQRLDYGYTQGSITHLEVTAGESFGFEDFAVCINDVIKLPIVCVEPCEGNKDDLE